MQHCKSHKHSLMKSCMVEVATNNDLMPAIKHGIACKMQQQQAVGFMNLSCFAATLKM